MQTWVVRQGEFLAKLAYTLDFDADSVWNDPANAELRKTRSNPNTLRATDVLYVPTPTDKPATSLVTGQLNSFVSEMPTVPVALQFQDADCASQGFSVPEQPDLTGLTTDQNGLVTLKLPVTLKAFTVVFADIPRSFSFLLGQLDPIETASGVFARLQNLGYIPIEVTFDPSDLSPIRSALRHFKSMASPDDGSSAQPLPTADGGNAEDAPPAADPSVDDDDGDADVAVGHYVPSDDDDDDSPSDDDDDLSGDDDDSSNSPAPQASASDPSTEDNAGLGDDGTLDEDTTKLLLDAYGC